MNRLTICIIIIILINGCKQGPRTEWKFIGNSCCIERCIYDQRISALRNAFSSLPANFYKDSMEYCERISKDRNCILFDDGCGYCKWYEGDMNE